MTYLFTMKAVTTEVPGETDIKCINHSYTTATTIFSCQQFLNLREQADKSRAFYRTMGLDSSKISTSRDKNSEGDALNWGWSGTTRQAGLEHLLDGILDSQKALQDILGETWDLCTQIILVIYYTKYLRRDNGTMLENALVHERYTMFFFG